MGRVREYFPEERPVEKRPGRKPLPAREVLEAVLWIVNTHAKWHMLPHCFPNYKTVHRRFQQWCEREVLGHIVTQLENTMSNQGKINESERFVDATILSAKVGGEAMGKSWRGKGGKILVFEDRHGLPLWVSTHTHNDSDALGDILKKDCVKPITSHRSSRKPTMQDWCRLRREALNFLGLVQLAAITESLKRF
ncbi:MAG: transposase [Nitrospira sp.]|nr:transposase [Nitrospira sp.]